MKDPANTSAADCESVRALAAWLPGGTLGEDERRRVEMHVATCERCADFLRFATALKNRLVAEEAASQAVATSPSVSGVESLFGIEPLSGDEPTPSKSAPPDHPSAEILVIFAEEASALAPEVRAQIEEHLERCADCAGEYRVLRAVTEGEAEEDADPERAGLGEARFGPVAARSAVAAADSGSARGWTVRLRRGWTKLEKTVLSPVPAAVYLTAATVALIVGMLPALREDHNALAPGSGAGGTNPAVAPVVLLYDTNDDVRGAGDGDIIAPVVERDREPLLLLEFTDLAAPPIAAGIYRVQISRAGGGAVVWEDRISGRTFRENYTLSLTLADSALEPGRYTVAVDDPDGERIFLSEFELR